MREGGGRGRGRAQGRGSGRWGVAMLQGKCTEARRGRGVAGLEAGLRGGAAPRRVPGLGAPERMRRPAAPQLGGAGAR